MKRVALALSVILLPLIPASGGAQTKPTTTPGASPAAAPRRWTGGVSGKSEMDDKPILVYRLEADNIVSGFLKQKRPTLLVRCQEGATSAYIDWSMPAHVESGDTRTVRVRFDGDPPTVESWTESTDDQALFSPDPKNLIRQISRAALLRVQFIPFRGNPQVATFQVRGFEPYMRRLGVACGWPEATGDGLPVAVYVDDAADMIETYHRRTCSLLKGIKTREVVQDPIPGAKPCSTCKPVTRERWK
jgi:hypothetical protein